MRSSNHLREAKPPGNFQYRLGDGLVRLKLRVPDELVASSLDQSAAITILIEDGDKLSAGYWPSKGFRLITKYVAQRSRRRTGIMAAPDVPPGESVLR